MRKVLSSWVKVGVFGTIKVASISVHGPMLADCFGLVVNLRTYRPRTARSYALRRAPWHPLRHPHPRQHRPLPPRRAHRHLLRTAYIARSHSRRGGRWTYGGVAHVYGDDGCDASCWNLTGDDGGGVYYLHRWRPQYRSSYAVRAQRRDPSVSQSPTSQSDVVARGLKTR